ncbi:hypothetical protein [Anabaena sp. PCC 7108]|uniref:hypothetical protein n=1 Tax=Anabaena sp. PCC 7108 TaxID=163908 RepID=UPI000348CE12|nr:hypothetical protein [Anabaena sp. PCC 7108]
MNVDEVLDTVEQSLLSRQLNSLERFILCNSWLGRSYSEIAPDCAYSIAHIKDIGSQLWQALSKALGEKVTKKNLFLVLKQYLLYRRDETVASDSLSVTLELVKVIDDSVEASYSEDSEQLPLVSDRCDLISDESSQLEIGQQDYQTFTKNPKAEDNKDAPAIKIEQIIPGSYLLLDYPLYVGRLLMEELFYTKISQIRCLIRIKPSHSLLEKNPAILNSGIRISKSSRKIIVEVLSI